MEELKALFDNGALTYEEFETKLTEGGFKLANLAGGNYVSTDKYNKLKKEYDEYKVANDASKYADYETIKAENETLRTEKTTAERNATLAEANVSEKFRKFVLAEVTPLVTKDTDFKTALTEYLKTNEQFVENENKSAPVRISSQVNLRDGDGDAAKDANRIMNDILRGK